MFFFSLFYYIYCCFSSFSLFFPNHYNVWSQEFVRERSKITTSGVAMTIISVKLCVICLTETSLRSSSTFSASVPPSLLYDQFMWPPRKILSSLMQSAKKKQKQKRTKQNKENIFLQLSVCNCLIFSWYFFF